MVTSLLKLLGLRQPAEDIPVTEAEIPSRNGERAPAYKDATIRLTGGLKLRAIAVDVDEQGARLRFTGHQSLTETVSVSINGFCRQRTARVAWSDGNDVGLQFVDT
ncbi:MAG: PilZ domain-containing protein [Pseudomonadota bacterium]